LKLIIFRRRSVTAEVLRLNNAVLDRRDFQDPMSKIDASKLSVMDIVRFDQDCFHTPAAEESIIACCGSKNHFKTAVSFWLHALFAEDWTIREEYFASYVRSGLCDPINSDTFYGKIGEYSNSLRRELPAFLLGREDLLWALKMYDDWDDVAVLGERRHDFIAFHWETSA
jgi:hypothetical protein